MKTLREPDLRKCIAALFSKAGATDENARIVADHLVDANLAGHESHGILRVAQYWQAIQDGEVFPDAIPKLLRTTGIAAVFDGQTCFGQVAGFTAMKEAISGAKSGGIGAATVSNCYHSGRLGSYVAQAADEGLIGIAMVNGGGGGQSVAPFGGAEPRLATNPLAIAAPQCDGFNLLLDFATSVVPEGKVRDLARRGEKLPEGCIVDHKGNPTTDPNDFYGPPQGSILPMGGNVGYKGFALGFMVDILAGALSGAGCCSKDETLARDGLLLLAIDPEHFSGAEYVRGQITALYQHIKSCRTAPGFEEVYTPGEIEHRMEQHRRLHGIPLDHATLDDLERISAELGLEWLLDSMTTAHTNGDAVDASPASRETTAK